MSVLIGFAVAFVVIALLANAIQGRLFGADASRIATFLSEIPAFLLLGAVAVLALRRGGVDLEEIGWSRSHARPALLAVGGIVVAVNAAAVGLALLAGRVPSVGLYAQYVRSLDATAAVLFLGAVSNYLFVGPFEELAFRGYVQNKLVDLVGGRGDRARTGAAILATAVLFAALHLPDVLLDEGTAITEAVGGLALVAATAVLFGVVYELTRNLVLVALLHGIGNWWPLVVDPGPGAWPNYGLLIALYAGMVLLYRRRGRSDPAATAA